MVGKSTGTFQVTAKAGVAKSRAGRRAKAWRRLRMCILQVGRLLMNSRRPSNGGRGLTTRGESGPILRHASCAVNEDCAFARAFAVKSPSFDTQAGPIGCAGANKTSFAARNWKGAYAPF